MKNEFMSKKYTLEGLLAKREDIEHNTHYGPIDSQITAKVRLVKIDDAIEKRKARGEVAHRYFSRNAKGWVEV